MTPGCAFIGQAPLLLICPIRESGCGLHARSALHWLLGLPDSHIEAIVDWSKSWKINSVSIIMTGTVIL